MITIIDYGVGNINAFLNVYKKLAIPAKRATSILDLENSTRLILPVTFFALSFGTVHPQFVHCTVPDDPFPPLVRPLLARLSGMRIFDFTSLYSCVP